MNHPPKSINVHTALRVMPKLFFQVALMSCAELLPLHEHVGAPTLQQPALPLCPNATCKNMDYLLLYSISSVKHNIACLTSYGASTLWLLPVFSPLRPRCVDTAQCALDVHQHCAQNICMHICAPTQHATHCLLHGTVLPG